MRNVESLEVTVETPKVLQALRKNREAHVTEYAEAKAAFLTQVTAKLREYANLADRGEMPDHGFRHDLQVPVDRVVEYDKYISMLELSMDEDMTLSTYQFDCFFNDTWEWAVSAKVINSSYAFS